MNWYDLPYKCKNHVARELTRKQVPDLSPSFTITDQINYWRTAAGEAMPEAGKKIDAMTNMQLLGLIAEVMGREDA